MNRRDTLKAIRALGLKAEYNADMAEYRIAFKGKTEAREESGAYYTSDSDDALGTARIMARRIATVKG